MKNKCKKYLHSAPILSVLRKTTPLNIQYNHFIHISLSKSILNSCDRSLKILIFAIIYLSISVQFFYFFIIIVN